MGVWEIVLRSLLAFALMMVIARIMGKPTIAQMTYHDFVASITLGAISANLAFNDKLAVWKILTAVIVFSGIAYLLMVLSLKNRILRKWLSGEPTVLIQDGKILERNMKKLKVSLDMLNQELRAKAIFNIEEVKYAILELNGHLSVMRTSDSMAVTIKDLNLKSDTKLSFPIELIMDGTVISNNLKQNGISEKWLDAELHKKNLSLEKVNYAVINSEGKVIFDEYEDHIRHAIDRE
ncbi:DUF421 domain-containing protein [Cohnella herbarum]|nr:DUF421 domain-containing protein [Cohnella herbarum]